MRTQNENVAYIRGILRKFPFMERLIDERFANTPDYHGDAKHTDSRPPENIFELAERCSQSSAPAGGDLDVDRTCQQGATAHTETIGERIFLSGRGTCREFNRTALGLVIADALIRGAYDDYEFIIAPQKQQTRLSYETFKRLSNFFSNHFGGGAARDTLECYLAAHDLNKIFVHADIYYNVESCLGSPHAQAIGHCMEIGCNIGQILQGEAPVVTAQKFVTLADEEQRLHLAMSICDIAAVKGHVEQTGSPILTETCARDLLVMIDQRKQLNLAEAFYKYKAATLLSGNFDRAVARTATRLSLMSGGLFTPYEVAKHLTDYSLAYACLTAELSLDGSPGRPAILPYFGPVYLRTLYDQKIAAYGYSAQNCLPLLLQPLQQLFIERRLDLPLDYHDAFFVMDFRREIPTQ